MELENVLKLINAVSESELTSFTLEEGDTKLSFGADRPDKYNNVLNKSDITTNNITGIINVTGSHFISKFLLLY